MALFSKTTKNIILRINDFFDNIDLGILIFREGMKSYFSNDMEAFQRHLAKIDMLESAADKLQREIENEMITHSILPQQKAEVTKLVDELDEIIDGIKSTLHEFDIEIPEIPSRLGKNFVSLSEASANAAESLVPAARSFFTAPHTVREQLLKVYYYESETDKIGVELKKSIFHNSPELDLAHKAHLRYIIHHIENISDLAQRAADLLSAMAIKVVM
jgi:predicted phosphate transport protein (TIGR00153 family)